MKKAGLCKALRNGGMNGGDMQSRGVYWGVKPQDVWLLALAVSEAGVVASLLSLRGGIRSFAKSSSEKKTLHKITYIFLK